MVTNCQKTQAFICRNIKIIPDIRNRIPGILSFSKVGIVYSLFLITDFHFSNIISIIRYRPAQD